MNQLLVLFTLLLSFSISAQRNTDSSDSLFVPKLDASSLDISSLVDTSIFVADINLPESPYTIENAQTRIRNGKPSIVIRGGFTGFPEMDDTRVEQFQKKYKVDFEYVGCVTWYDKNTEDISGYNQTIFDYMEIVYGARFKSDFEQL